MLLHDLPIMTALLHSDPLWPINKWDMLTSKRIFHLSRAYDPNNKSSSDQSLRKREGLLDVIFARARMARGGTSALGPINGIKKGKEMNKSTCKSICVHLKWTETNISEAETECL